MSFGRKPPLPPLDELRERFGVNVRRHRERLGVSQHELAFRADTHITQISPIELGQKLPRIDTFIRLAGALEVRADDLTVGILWLPAETIITPGSFDVPDNADLSAEVATLREQAMPGRRESS